MFLALPLLMETIQIGADAVNTLCCCWMFLVVAVVACFLLLSYISLSCIKLVYLSQNNDKFQKRVHRINILLMK